MTESEDAASASGKRSSDNGTDWKMTNMWWREGWGRGSQGVSQLILENSKHICNCKLFQIHTLTGLICRFCWEGKEKTALLVYLLFSSRALGVTTEEKQQPYDWNKKRFWCLEKFKLLGLVGPQWRVASYMWLLWFQSNSLLYVQVTRFTQDVLIDKIN